MRPLTRAPIASQDGPRPPWGAPAPRPHGPLPAPQAHRSFPDHRRKRALRGEGGRGPAVGRAEMHNRCGIKAVQEIFSTKWSILLAICVLASPLSAQERPNDYNRLGQLAYAQWDCAAYAAYTEDFKEEGSQLFEAGYKNLSVFVSAWAEGELTQENTKDVPIGIWWRLISSPSIDFSLGYMWSQFKDEAYEETWDSNLETSLEDRQVLQKMKAENTYRAKNCRLLSEHRN